MNLLDLLVTFLKIGAFSFGGGYAMIPFFEREIAAHNWAAASDYTKVIALAQVLPGPFAIDSSAYIGYKVGGLPGALIASIALSLPSFLALVVITKYYIQFKSNETIQLVFSGIRPVVIGLLVSAAYIIGLQPVFREMSGILSFDALKAAAVITVGYLLLRFTRINPILFIVVFAVIGVVLY